VWEQDKGVTWDRRWDRYLFTSSNGQIHWYSIIHSLVITVCLSVLAAVILLRSLNMDIAHYTDEEVLMEDVIGWKLLHGDVFRPPRYLRILAALVGTGAQVFSAILVTTALAMLGVVNPSYQGSLIAFSLFLFACFGCVGGYTSVALSNSFHRAWRPTATWTALFVPGLFFALFFLLNLLVWMNHSSAAIPFGTFLALVAIWFGISTPSTFVGGYYANKRCVYRYPTRTNTVARQIPTQPWYVSGFASALLGGLIPFTVLFVELYFVLYSMWHREYYYTYGFLFLIVVIVFVVTAQVAVVMVYFILCSENHQWWWRCYGISFACTLYMLGYAAFYYYTKLKLVGFVATLIYVCNMVLFCSLYGLAMGSVGFLAAWWFVRKLFSTLKVD
jgi:transmembrane 9 superfamily protein 2/4